MHSVRFGIIGLGNMGAIHARTLLSGQIKGAQLKAVCDSDARRLDDYRKSVKVFTDLTALVKSGVIDALLIATPHFAHPEAVQCAFEAGLHVLVEKPIAVHKADGERMLAAHTNPRLRFGAMFNQRTNPAYRKIRDVLRSGALGPVRRVQWTLTDWFRSDVYYASSPWRATWAGEGGGVLVNQSPHQLDLLCWLFGAPARVRAFCHFGKHHAIEVEDEVTAYLEFPDGMTGVFITSTGEAPGTNRLEIAADRGRVVYEQGQLRFTRNEVSAAEFCRTTQELFGLPATTEELIPIETTGGQHAEILQNFTDTVLGAAAANLLAPASEGLHSVELANAMLLSTWLDRTVDLPIDGDLFCAELNKRIASSARFDDPAAIKDARPAVTGG